MRLILIRHLGLLETGDDFRWIENIRSAKSFSYCTLLLIILNRVYDDVLTIQPRIERQDGRGENCSYRVFL